jgi:hypothetical protein
MQCFSKGNCRIRKLLAIAIYTRIKTHVLLMDVLIVDDVK